MTNVRCTGCGTVNLITDEVCKFCGAELRSPVSEGDTPDSSPRVYGDAIPPFEGASDGIGPTFRLFKNNFWLITKIVFVIVAPFEIFKALSVGQERIDWQLSLGLFAMQLLCNALLAPALFYALLKVIQTGSAPTVNEAYRWSLAKFPKMALAALISWILILLGLVLLVIPGIILSLAFFVVYPVAVFEKDSAIDALRRSSQLTRGYRWDILAASIVIGLLASVIMMVVGGAATILLLNGINYWPLEAAVAIVSDIFSEAGNVLALVIYLGLLRTLESGRSVIE